MPNVPRPRLLASEDKSGSRQRGMHLLVKTRHLRRSKGENWFSEGAGTGIAGSHEEKSVPNPNRAESLANATDSIIQSISAFHERAE